MNELLWSPPAERVASSNLAAFAARVGKSALVQRRDYAALWQRSVEATMRCRRVAGS